MALLKCPECENNVSEYAEKCPNCGCPSYIIMNRHKDTEKMYTIINGEKKDVTEYVVEILNHPLKGGGNLKFYQDFNKKITKNLDVPMLGFVKAVEECGGAPIEYNAPSIRKMNQEQEQKDALKPKCPHCHSTNIAKISTTERAASVLGLGLLSKKINKSFKCKNCGYTW